LNVDDLCRHGFGVDVDDWRDVHDGGFGRSANGVDDWERLPVEPRSLKHAKAAAAIALHSNQTFALAGTEQIKQSAEPVAPLVERTRPQDLLHVAQVHRPPGAARCGEQPAGHSYAFRRIPERLERWLGHVLVPRREGRRRRLAGRA
jgi:hypothetical protein